MSNRTPIFMWRESLVKVTRMQYTVSIRVTTLKALYTTTIEVAYITVVSVQVRK